LKSKSILYLSIIISSFFVGKLFNPIPVTNYALYVIVTAMFLPYFGRGNSVKIVFVLLSVSMVQDIPFYLMFYQQWPSIYASIMMACHSLPAQAASQSLSIMQSTFNPGILHLLPSVSASQAVGATNTVLTLQSNPAVVLGVFVVGVYAGLLNGMLALSKLFRKYGVYRRLMF
jgi:hypothetical protein